jgi:hypothetical protein
MQAWPLWVQDREGRRIYLTEERWQHALDHPGMSEALLDAVLATIRTGHRKQDRYEPDKYKYSRAFANLPAGYTHVVVLVKFGWAREDPTGQNNFVLTAYLVRKRQR